MNVTTITQPETQLGLEIDLILEESEVFSRIIFVSAFVSLRTTLRLRERLLTKAAGGSDLRFNVGIDLGGTSREVLEELLRWDCEVNIFHNAIPRSTFHPKVYLFERETKSTLFIGSNNLTDGGFYTNYEAATRYDFELADDEGEYHRILGPLGAFLDPSGSIVQSLDADLITTLIARGELPSEADARRGRRAEARARRSRDGDIPPNPFGAIGIQLPPLLPDNLRQEEPAPHADREAPEPVNPSEDSVDADPERFPPRVLMWRKSLSNSDALQVAEGTNHVGGVRLTQARFENPQGTRIDWTRYFRQMFADYPWEREFGHTQQEKEHAFVPMRIIIRGQDYGIRNFEISHKPSGEAGQANYTTILRWGQEFTPIVVRENLAGAVFSLYETADDDVEFAIDIT
ncbi:MAG: phospholipase D family protein [Akkermansiaceae bacterium]|nr:phospholipase D family protein [Akkermansiaceae bacterium]